MSSFKQYLRIRPIDYASEMISVQDNSLTIRDTSFKMNQNAALSGMQADDQSFKFDRILNQDANQDRVFNEIGVPSIEKVLQGVSSLIVCYGQTGSGKTFSSFGQHPEYLVDSHSSLEDPFSNVKVDNRGLVPRSIEYLLQKVQELQATKEIVISMSFAEIYQDRVRDLGKLFLQQEGGKKTLNIEKVMKDMETENLTLYENTNGQIVIKDISQIQLEGIQQLYGILKTCFQLREAMELKGVSIWERTHTVFTVNVIQKDKENENIPFSNCFLQVVDLAGSERIAKSLTEGISLKAKSIPYKESKLSRLLQNSMQPRSYITLIGNINPSESNYEECVSSLQFIERCSKEAPKMLPIAQNPNISSNIQNSSNLSQNSSNDKAILMLQRENQELKDKIDKIQTDTKKRWKDVQMLLGIDVELDKLFSKSSTRELNSLKQQKDAIVRLDNIMKQNEELEKTIDKLHMHIEELKRAEHKKAEQQNCIIIELSEQLKNLKEQANSKDMNVKNDLRQFQKDKDQNIRQLIERSNAILEEKANLVFNLPQFVQNKTQDNQKITELKKATKQEAEKEYKAQVEVLKKEYQQLLENTKTQFEFFLKQKNEQIEEYVNDSKKYREEKKKQITEMQFEMSDMYDVLSRLSAILTKVEMGHYSGGIKSANIPEKEKPILPARQKYKQYKKYEKKNKGMSRFNTKSFFIILKSLFKVLDLKSLGQGSFKNTGEVNKKAVALTAKIQDLHKINNASSVQQKDQQLGDQGSQLIGSKNAKEDENNRIDVVINLNQFKSKDDFLSVKNYAERLKQTLQKQMIREKELQARVDDFSKLNNNVDISSLLKERDEFKALYHQQLRKYNQARIVLESQSRLLNMPKHNNSQMSSPQQYTRPGTASSQITKSMLKLPIALNTPISAKNKIQ